MHVSRSWSIPLHWQAALASLPSSEADQRRAALERRIAQHSAQVSAGNVMVMS